MSKQTDVILQQSSRKDRENTMTTSIFHKHHSSSSSESDSYDDNKEMRFFNRSINNIRRKEKNVKYKQRGELIGNTMKAGAKVSLDEDLLLQNLANNLESVNAKIEELSVTIGQDKAISNIDSALDMCQDLHTNLRDIYQIIRNLNVKYNTTSESTSDSSESN